jgi:fermentation-respiration switch protein FrsA (DUF1100 family)
MLSFDIPLAEAEMSTTQPVLSPLELQLVFPGTQSQGKSSSRVQTPVGCELIRLRAADGAKIVALFGKGSASSHTPKFTLLFFYGNGTCMADCLSVFNQLRALGFNVIMADYEGYGMSDGTPSEAGCYATADASYGYVLTRKEVDQTRILATGWSLGGAVAIDLASRKQIAGLATFSAFTNIGDMGQTLVGDAGTVAALAFNSRFDNLAKIGSIGCPIFLAHGTNDQLVPPEMLDRLAHAAKAKVTIVRVTGAGHNDLFQRDGDAIYKRLGDFVNRLGPSSQPSD